MMKRNESQKKPKIKQNEKNFIKNKIFESIKTINEASTNKIISIIIKMIKQKTHLNYKT